MKKVVVFIFVIALIIGSCNNLILAQSESVEINALNENIFTLISEKSVRNEKIEQSIVSLITYSQNDNPLKSVQMKDFNFVGEKIRLEIILTDELMLNNLANFSSDIEIENHYKSLAQILIPIDKVHALSEEKYVNYIRNPVEATPDVISEGVNVIGANLVQNAGYYGSGVKVAVIDVGFEDYDINPEIPSERIIEVISYRAGHDIEYGGNHGVLVLN